MRWVLARATVPLLLMVVPVWAQHGGAHASAGGHGSGMASHGGFSGHASGHAFGGTHSGSGFSGHSSTRAFSRSPLASRNFNRFNANRFNGPRIRTRGFRNNCYWYGCGWGYGYPYLGAGVDPYWWWDSGSADDQGQYDNGAYDSGNYYGQDPGDQDVYAGSAPPPPRQSESGRSVPPLEQKTEVAPATVLVFRDQHQQEVQNYAIVGQTLWTFAPQRTQKIPLTDLDLPATTKANDERGVDFRVPGV